MCLVMVEGEKEREAEDENDIKTRERMYSLFMKGKVVRMKQYWQLPIPDSTLRSTQPAFKKPSPEN